MEKYYTPTEEEFHMGFEYEQNSFIPGFNPKGDWGKQVYRGQLLSNPRVKYLDRDDIEACGWKYTGRSICLWFKKEVSDTPGGRHRLTHCQFSFEPKTRECKIEAFMGTSSEGVLFEGFLKNISELRRLMQQLNIKI